MNQGAKVGIGVTGGYLLGRQHKLKLALGMGAWLLGKRLSLNPSTLAMQGADLVRANPELNKLGDEVRGQLLTAGRRAASAAVQSRADSLADAIRARRESLDNGQSADSQESS